MIGERRSFGNRNPDKTFLLIKLNNHSLGLFGIYNCILGYLRFSNDNGFIPVIDLKNYKNGYLEDSEIGKNNAWEYYFEQPSSFSLEDVYQSKNVILASGIAPFEGVPVTLKYYYSRKASRKRYFNIIRQQLKIKPAVKLIIEKEFKNLIANKRVIGVIKRGTDIINASKHSIQPDVLFLIKKTKEMLHTWNCDYIFLATEEGKTVEVFKEHFADKLLINEGSRVMDYNEKIPYTNISFNREHDKYLKGLEYLTTVVLLSRCNCLIASMVGSTFGAIGINGGKYENVYIYDMGEYK